MWLRPQAGLGGDSLEDLNRSGLITFAVAAAIRICPGIIRGKVVVEFVKSGGTSGPIDLNAFGVPQALGFWGDTGAALLAILSFVVLFYSALEIKVTGYQISWFSLAGQ